jgi:hypothetical protein
MIPRRHRLWTLAAALLLCLAPALAVAEGDEAAETTVVPLFAASVVYGSELVTLSPEGALTAWDIAARRKDAALTAKLASLSPQFLAAGAGTLWAAADQKIWRWDAGASAWTPFRGFRVSWGPPSGLAVVGDEVYFLGEYQIVRVSDGKMFRFPHRNKKDFYPLGTLFTGYSAIEVYGAKIWLGLAWGEWGGAVLVLDTASGEWTYDVNGLAYVTGFARLGESQVAVGWAMDHLFMNSGDITLADNDGHVTDYMFPLPDEGASEQAAEGTEFPLSYVQALAYDKKSDTLYAVDAHDLIAIWGGEVVERVPLGKLPFPYGSLAVGVGPSIVGLYAVAGEVIAVHYARLPFVYANGVLSQMTE